jgi:drug/metabolite transporter (DMT)-like permease
VNNKKLSAIILALVGAILFSSKAVMVKLSYEYNIDSLSLLLLRMGFSLPIYLFIAFKNPQKKETDKLSTKDWLTLVFLGVIGYYLASFLDFLGLQYITASLERLVLFIYPTITTILAAIYFKRRITIYKIIAIVFTYIGIGVAFWGEIQGDIQEDFWLGVILIFASAITFSIYLVGSEKLIPKFGAKRFTTYCMIVSCVSVLIHFGIKSDVDITSFPWQVYVLGMVIAFFNTVLPSYMMSAAIKTIGSSTTSILSSVGPISVIILGYFLLGEQISYYQISGTFIVIIGVLIMSRK